MQVIIANGEKTEIFATIFHHIKTKISHINLNFNKNHLYIQGMDDAHVGLLELTLQEEWFQKYDIDENKILGIHCEIFHKMLHCMDKTHDIILSCSEDHLLLAFESSDPAILDIAFELPLLDLDVTILKVPNVEYTADITLPSKIIEQLINDLVLFATTVNIQASEDGVNIETTKSSSITQGVMKTSIKIEQMEEYCIEEDEKINLNFSLTYLKWMVEFSKLSTLVSFHLSAEYPFKMKYDLKDNSHLLVFLAPQMDDY